MKTLLLLAVLTLVECSSLKEGYLVGLQKNGRTNVFRFPTEQETKQCIQDNTGLELDVNSMFGEKPYFDLQNDTLHLYVEQKLKKRND